MRTVLHEEDRVLRLAAMVLDPAVPADIFAAYADYLAHDLPDFAGWCGELRAQLPHLHPARVLPVADQAALRAQLPQAEAVFVESLAIGAAELACAPRLKVVQQFGTQTDNIDLAACRARGIEVLTVRRRSNTNVAEHTLMLMLALAKRLPAMANVVTADQLAAAGRPFRSYDRRHVPGANYGRFPGIVRLEGLTLGILGLGEIGSQVAALARALGMRVLYHKRQRLDAAREAAQGVAWRDIEDLFSEADVLSIHLPSDAATAGLVGAPLLDRMKRGAFLINTSRAQVIERAALVALADRHWLAGMALDVHYEEPVRPDDALRGREDVLLVPHTAGGSRLNGLADMVQMLRAMDAVLAD